MFQSADSLQRMRRGKTPWKTDVPGLQQHWIYLPHTRRALEMKHQDLFNQVKYVLGKSDYRYLEIPESDLTGCALGVAWELTDFVVISTNQLRPGVVTVSAPALSGLTNPDDTVLKAANIHNADTYVTSTFTTTYADSRYLVVKGAPLPQWVDDPSLLLGLIPYVSLATLGLRGALAGAGEDAAITAHLGPLGIQGNVPEFGAEAVEDMRNLIHITALLGAK